MEENSISYAESCFIVNSMNYYLATFLPQRQDFSDEDRKYYENIIKKYEKLEEQIMNLKIN